MYMNMFCSLEVLNKGIYKYTCKNKVFKDNNHCVNILPSNFFDSPLTMHMTIIIIVSTITIGVFTKSWSFLNNEGQNISF